MPLAFDYQVIGEKFAVDDEIVALARRFVDGWPDWKLFQILFPADCLAVFKCVGLVVPELYVAFIFKNFLDELLKLIACSLSLSPARLRRSS